MPAIDLHTPKKSQVKNGKHTLKFVKLENCFRQENRVICFFFT